MLAQSNSVPLVAATDAIELRFVLDGLGHADKGGGPLLRFNVCLQYINVNFFLNHLASNINIYTFPMASQMDILVVLGSIRNG